MSFQLKNYQQKAIDDLIGAARSLLETSSSSRMVLRSPTGSGKTIMMAEALKGLLQESLPNQYVFIWVSFYKIHLQSYHKIKQYLAESQYQIIQLEDLQNKPLDQNTLLFVNWHSLTTKKRKTGEYSNKYMRDREDGRTLKNILDQTRKADKETILIIDEAHQHYTSKQSREFIDDIIRPVLRIEVSATPQAPQSTLLSQRVVKVSREDVIQSGLIKESCVLNASIGDYHIDQSSINETVLKAALEKRKQLAKLYQQADDIDINPLVLVQLPSQTKKLSNLDSSVLAETERHLFNNGATYENGKLALWLSDDKKNLEGVESIDSKVEVLIFKQAVATGWDCPRAQVLVMLREIGSLVFKVQVIGRIMRMPQAHHYQNHPDLNKAYVFSNLNDIEFDQDIVAYIPFQEARLKPGIKNINLPKEYAPRQDYGDLTAIFSQILIDCLNWHFNIKEVDIFNQIQAKVKNKLDLEIDKLKFPLLVDTIIANIDMGENEIQRLDKKYIELAIADKDIQAVFDFILKRWCQPYVPSRSISKIKSGLYSWFSRMQYGYEDTQRILVCSETNQNFFGQIIETAKLKYAKQHEEDVKSRNIIQKGSFGLPKTDSFGGNYKSETSKNYAYDKCYLKNNRSNPEKQFENILNRSDLISWWYKNGEGQQQYFSIVYKTLDENLKIEKYNNFYPDYICQFKTGFVGIYEIKSGDIDQNKEAKRKALKDYLERHQHLRLQGGLFDLSKAREEDSLKQDLTN